MGDGLLVGYGRVSTVLSQDVATQRRLLSEAGCAEDRIYLDHGYTGGNTNRPALQTALAVLRPGDTLVVTKLDRLARSLVDAHALARQVTDAGARLRFDGLVLDLANPVGKLLFSMLAMIAEFERDLIRMRTREGLATAKRKGRLRGRPPKLAREREALLVSMVRAGDRTVAEVARVFGVDPATVRRALRRAGVVSGAA